MAEWPPSRSRNAYLHKRRRAGRPIEIAFGRTLLPTGCSTDYLVLASQLAIRALFAPFADMLLATPASSPSAMRPFSGWGHTAWLAAKHGWGEPITGLSSQGSSPALSAKRGELHRPRFRHLADHDQRLAHGTLLEKAATDARGSPASQRPAGVSCADLQTTSASTVRQDGIHYSLIVLF